MLRARQSSAVSNQLGPLLDKLLSGAETSPKVEAKKKAKLSFTRLEKPQRAPRRRLRRLRPATPHSNFKTTWF